MAKVKHNLFTQGLSGKYGNLVFRQMKDGTTVVASLPDFSDRVLSDEQLGHQSRFKQASAYAKIAAKTQPIYKELTQNTSSNPYNLALSDWFNPPVINAVTRQANTILVDAKDNVLITKVVVTIFDKQGQILEQGEAALINDAWWEYAASAPTEAKI